MEAAKNAMWRFNPGANGHEVYLRVGDGDDLINSRNKHVAHHSWDDQTPNYDRANLGAYGLRVTATSSANVSFDNNDSTVKRTVNLGVTILVAVLGW